MFFLISHHDHSLKAQLPGRGKGEVDKKEEDDDGEGKGDEKGDDGDKE